jgi:hypothetical protein
MRSERDTLHGQELLHNVDCAYAELVHGGLS